MKQTEPAKKVIPIASRGAEDHSEASAATRKQLAPTANRTAVQAIVGCSSLVRAATARDASGRGNPARVRERCAKGNVILYACT